MLAATAGYFCFGVVDYLYLDFIHDSPENKDFSSISASQCSNDVFNNAYGSIDKITTAIKLDLTVNIGYSLEFFKD